MRFLVIGLPKFPLPFDQLPGLLELENQWYERYRDRIEVHGWFPGGGGFFIGNIEDDVMLNRLVIEHPFAPFSETSVRPFVDHDTGLGQLRQLVQQMAAG